MKMDSGGKVVLKRKRWKVVLEGMRLRNRGLCRNGILKENLLKGKGFYSDRCSEEKKFCMGK